MPTPNPAPRKLQTQGSPSVGDRVRGLLERLPVQLPEQLTVRATQELNTKLRWLNRLRLRVFALSLGLVIAAIAAVSLTAVPLWPALGAAIAAVAVAINGWGSRLSHPTCMACGGDLSDEPSGPHGVICPGCGSINTPMLAQLPAATAEFETLDSVGDDVPDDDTLLAGTGATPAAPPAVDGPHRA